MKSNVIYLPAVPPPPPPPPSAWSPRSLLSRCAALVSWPRRPARRQTEKVAAIAPPRRPRRPARVIDLDAARARLRPPAAALEASAVAE
jgi:hypothetical protein